MSVGKLSFNPLQIEELSVILSDFVTECASSNVLTVEKVKQMQCKAIYRIENIVNGGSYLVSHNLNQEGLFDNEV